MKTYKFGKGLWFLIALLAGTTVLAAFGIPMLFRGEVSYADGPMGNDAIILGCVLTAVALTYVISLISVLRHFIAHKGTAMVLTDAGIENSIVVVNLLAFFFVFSVKLVPWKAVTCLEWNDKMLHMKVDAGQIKASPIAKLFIRLFGFPCGSMAKPAVTAEDLEPYMAQLSLQ